MSYPPRSKGRKIVRAFGLALILSGVAAMGAPAKTGGQLYYNQDCTDFFWHTQIAEGKAGEAIDRYVDVIADAGVTVFFCNSNARRTNYRSKVWDAFWDGYDPAGPDDQPFLASIPRADLAGYRKGVGNMLATHEQGVDYPARVIGRCRQRGVSPWISLRMNDCHYNDIPTHPFHGRFWKENPGFIRQNCSGYYATCLDYARPEVRDYFMALIEETLERYDIDGLELDFMREPYLFSADKEKEGSPILTQWMRDVRKQVSAAAAKRGHPIRIGVRLPTRPDVSLAMGLDAATWANEGLIDLVVATPRWSTIQFDHAISEWRQLLGTNKVTLVGGLEIRYQSIPGGPASPVTPELAFGGAASVLAKGADAVYLFNYFPGVFSPPVYQSTLSAMASLDSLKQLPRRIGITHRDIKAPGEKYQPPLPATGRQVAFPIYLGPLPEKNWLCDVVVGLVPNASGSTPAVRMNGVLCDFLSETTANGLRLVSYRIPAEARKKIETHEITVASGDDAALSVQQLEVVFAPPEKK